MATLAGCDAGTSSSSAGVARASTATGAATSTTTGTPFSPIPASPDAVGRLAACPPTTAMPERAPLARLDAAVDDAVVTDDGHIWVSAETTNVILELDPGGAVLRRLADAAGPEGLVELPDGTLVVAEQRANRLSILDRRTGALHPALSLPNTTGRDGVDGIALDASRARLLVPDSPNGRLLAVPLTGSKLGTPTTLASALGRPVAADVMSDGTVAVAVENAPGLVGVHPDGTTAPLTKLTSLDEVISAGGLLYIADLARQAFSAVDPRDGSHVDLVVGSPMPQGLARRPDGSFLLIDSSLRIVVVERHC